MPAALGLSTAAMVSDQLFDQSASISDVFPGLDGKQLHDAMEVRVIRSRAH